eukprot:6204598-Pleurochrysis_carterae.AAC.1
MAEFLTLVDSKSLNFGTPPDENYARELMQLFTIGLYELNMNGTVMRKPNGEAIATYATEAIMSFARAWTGLSRQPARTNVELTEDGNALNSFDPMRHVAIWRDAFPKMNLHRGYL